MYVNQLLSSHLLVYLFDYVVFLCYLQHEIDNIKVNAEQITASSYFCNFT